MEVMIEYGKILIPAAVVLYAAYLMVKAFISKEIELKKLEIRTRSIETILPNRLQAYERMCLFLERVSPPNMLMRLNNPGYSAREFHKFLLDEVRNEYNHNVSQQIYMSEEVWSMVKNAKEDLTILINEASADLPSEATGLDLSRKIFELTLEKKVDPIGHALSELKKEIQQTF
jgi:hypothetical protein